MQLISRFIDAAVEFAGQTSSYLILPLIGMIGYEVVMRYAFNAPTTWAFELSTFVYGVHFIMGLAYAHKHNSHVSIDVFEVKLPHKPRIWLRIVTNLAFFIPIIGILAYGTIIYAATSWGYRELSWSSWQPKIYPYKALMALGFILFFLQGVAKLIDDIRSLRSSDQA